MAVSPQTAAPTLASLKANEVAALEKSPKAVRVVSVKALALPAGQALGVHYGANSDPNPVTNKAIRLDNARYYFWKAGKLATLTVSAPAVDRRPRHRVERHPALARAGCFGHAAPAPHRHRVPVGQPAAHAECD